MSTPLHFRCPDCGPHVAADEDGCCATCGADCVGEPCGGHVCGADLAEARETIRRLTASLTECVARLRQIVACEDARGRECPWCGNHMRASWSHAADCTGIAAIQRAEALLALDLDTLAETARRAAEETK